MRKFQLNCAHCAEAIELRAMDFCALNRPFGQYDCNKCGKKSSLPNKASNLASLALNLSVIAGMLLSYKFQLNWLVTALASIAVGSYISILVGSRADHLTKYKDQLYAAKKRPLYQNLLIYVGIPALAFAAIIYLLFKYGPR